MKTVKTNKSGYVMDVESRAVHATDDEYQEFLKKRAARKQEKSLSDEVKILTNKVHNLEQQLAELLLRWPKT